MTEFLGWSTLGLGIGLVYGVLALGIVLVYKGTKIINFAHPFMGLVTAFVAWWLTHRAGFMPFTAGSRPRFAIAAVLSLVIIGLNGLALERSIFHRLRHSSRLTQLVATIAVGSGLLGLMVLLFQRGDAANETRRLPTLLCDPNRAAECAWTFEIGNVTITPAYVQIFLVVPAIAAGLFWFFQKTKFGVGVRASAENPDAARLLGISADRVSQFTWVTGSLLAGVAALLIVPISSLDVSSLSTGFLVRALAAALVGGLVSLPGAVVGGLIVGMVETMVKWQYETPGLPEIGMFAVVLGFLVFRPGGIFGTAEEAGDEAAFVPAVKPLTRYLREHAITPWFGRYWWFTIAAFLLAVSQVVGSATNGVLIRVTAFAIVGVSLTVLMGFSGQISLGHWALAGVGAFATGNLLTNLEWPFLLTVRAVVLIGVAVSLLLGVPALRIRGLYLAVITLAFSLACEVYLFKGSFISGSTSGITIDGPQLGPLDLDDIDGRGLFPFALACLAASMWVARNLASSRTGRAFYAARENERAATVLGIDLRVYRLIAFAVSGGIASLGGMVFALNQGLISNENFLTSTSLVLVSMVVIGGLGSVEGAVLGAFVVYGLPELLHFANGWIVEIGTGVLLIVVITRAPAGLAGVLGAAKVGLLRSLVQAADADRPAPSSVAEPSASSAATAG